MVLQATLRGVFQNMCFVFHTYPPKVYASEGVFMWSQYSIIPWVPWSAYLSPHLLESHLAFHPSSWPVRDKIEWFKQVVTATGWGPRRTHLHSFSGQWLLWDETLGGQIYVLSGCKVDLATKMPEGQNYTVFGENGFWLKKGHWRKPLHSFGCQGRLGFLRIA